MTEQYLIEWVSTVNGRTGRGTKYFNRDEAEALAAELNEEFPTIQHRAVPAQVDHGPEAPANQPEQVVSVE